LLYTLAMAITAMCKFCSRAFKCASNPHSQIWFFKSQD